jgi:ABC-type phosphate/phosphonate transport system substrate-binding protein
MRFGVAAVLAVGAAGPVRAADDGVKIQVVKGLFADVPEGMVTALGGPLKDMIAAKTGLKGNFTLAPDALTLADRMTANECQLGVFHGFEFAWARAKNPDLVPLVVTVPPTGKLQVFVLVHKDAKAAKLGDLKGESITVPIGSKGHCWAYLAKERAGLADGCAEAKAEKVTPEGALDAVVNGTSAAALVDVAAWAGYQKIHPAASGKLRVLCESDSFPQNVIAYNKGSITPAQAKDLADVLTQAHAKPGGKPLMMLWNIKGFDAIPANYEKQLDASIKAYPAPAVKTGTTGRTGGTGGRSCRS